MPTFRAVDDDEVVRHQEVREHAFVDDAGPPDYEGPGDVDDETAERWGLFDDGRLVSVCLIHDLRVALAGERTTVGGLGGFATAPEHRGAGYGERLQRELLAEFREREYPFAVLWPASVPYYRRTGWGLVNCRTEYAFPPEAVRGIGRDVGGELERVRPDEFERLVPAYEAFVDGYELALDRSPDWWRERVLEGAWAYAWTPDGATDPAGYVAYTFASDGASGSTLQVSELAYGSESARRALVGFLARHLPQVETVEWTAPAETRLLHDATDPKAVDATVEPGPMGRIVDVASAIEALTAARNPDGPVTVAVRDSLVGANDDAVRIAPGESGPTCERLGRRADADVTASVALLSKLFVGTVSARTASDRGALDATDGVVDRLEPLFPPREVYFGDFF